MNNTIRAWVAGVLLLAGVAAAWAGEAARIFNVRQLGAAGDGTTLDTAAVNNAIAACSAAGGGRVVFPAGTYLSGTVLLKSGVTLDLAAGASIKGTPDLTQYRQFTPLAESPEARFGKWHRALILADGAHDIAITGAGTIDGNKVFDPTGEERMRGPHAIILGNCRGALLRGVTVRDAANYAVMIEFSDDVTVDGVTFRGGWDGVHFRGWQTRWCHKLSVTHCKFMTGDDSIAGRYGEDVTVRDCSINSSCNGVRIIGPMRRLTLENCTFDGPGVEPHRSSARHNMLAGILLQPGGWDACPGPLEDVRISSVTMRNVASAVGIWMKRPGNTLDRIAVERLRATGVYRAAMSVESWSAAPVGRVSFRDVQVTYNGGQGEDPKRRPAAPPSFAREPGTDPRTLPPWGFYARNAERLELENVQLRGPLGETRPKVKTEGVKVLALKGLETPQGSAPAQALEISSGTQVLNGRKSN